MPEIIDRWQALDGTQLEMRQMRQSDEPQVKEALNKLSSDARRNRFFATIAEFSEAAVHQFITVDPAREYLLVVMRREDGADIPIAGGRFVHEDDRPECAFSLLIGDAWQGQGIGRRILKALIGEACKRGLQQMYGHVLADNRPMLELARSQRFAVTDSDQGQGVLKIARDLPRPTAQQWKTVLRRLWP